MPVTGRKPKPEGLRRNRSKPAHDWIDVPDRPYDGERPTLPSKRQRLVKVIGGADRYDEVKLQALTRRWWRAISTMPHCVLWTGSDWMFALETALIADRVFAGEAGAAGELRQREKILGTTVDARRGLRIRYVDPDAEAQDEQAPADVASMAAYREMFGAQ